MPPSPSTPCPTTWTKACLTTHRAAVPRTGWRRSTRPPPARPSAPASACWWRGRARARERRRRNANFNRNIYLIKKKTRKEVTIYIQISRYNFAFYFALWLFTFPANYFVLFLLVVTPLLCFKFSDCGLLRDLQEPLCFVGPGQFQCKLKLFLWVHNLKGLACHFKV